MASKNLSAKNKAFWAKSKPEQRVAVAKDVLKQIESGFYTATRGGYLSLRSVQKVYNVPIQLDTLLAFLKKEKAKCEVCGIGSIFVSMVNIGNKVTTQECGLDSIEECCRVGDGIMRDKLNKIFSPEQRSLIECAFEKSTYLADDDHNYTADNNSIKKIENAKTFGLKYKTDTDRLKAIMKNIIKNKGEFIP